MEKQISIIIPTYNMEKYLGKCLDSLLIPEIDAVDIIVVNDGSKDRSSEIAHSYADRFPHSIRVIDKPNGNYGSCINAALPTVRGRYVKVLDADDTYDTPVFSEFVKRLKDTNVDVVVTKSMKIDKAGHERGLVFCTDFGIHENEPFDINYAKAYLTKFYIAMHCIAYKKDVFSRLSYKQTEGISYTDTQWATIPLIYCRTFIRYDLTVYRYLLGREGQTANPAQLKKSASQVRILSNYFLDYYESHADSLFYPDILKGQIAICVSGFYKQLIYCISSEAVLTIKEIDKRLTESFPWLYDRTDKIVFSEYTKYHMVRELRRKNYPKNFRIPRYVCILHSFRIRAKKYLGLK